MAPSERNNNMVPSLQVKSNAGNNADVVLWADPTTHKLLVQTTGDGGTAETDDTAFTIGSGVFTPVGGQYSSSLDSVDDGDAGVFHMTVKRALHVNLRDASGNEVSVSGASMTDDAAFTPGTTAISPMGAFFDDVAPDSVNEGDGGVVRMSGNRNLYVTLRDAAGNERGLNIDASGQVAITLAAAQTLATVTTVSTVTAIGTSVTPGTSAAHLGKAEDAAHSSGDTGVFALGVANEAQSSLAADGDYIAQATDTKGNRLVIGNVAHDAADAGAPVKIGGKAVNAEITAVAANDRTNLITDLVGKLIVLPYANPENFVSGVTAAMTGTTSTSLIAAPAAGLRNYITHIIGSNSHATVGTFILIQDGSGGTTLYEGYAAAVGGGFSISFPVPLRQPTTATAIYCQNVTTGANTIVAASGYKGI